MDEAVVAEVDADVREREAPRVEEHEVARLQVAALDLASPSALISFDVRGSVTPVTCWNTWRTRPLQSRPLVRRVPPNR